MIICWTCKQAFPDRAALLAHCDRPIECLDNMARAIGGYANPCHLHPKPLTPKALASELSLTDVLVSLVESIAGGHA